MWLSVEKKFANEELETIRSAERPWKVAEFKDSKGRSDCMVMLVTLVEEFQRRFHRIPSLLHHFSFSEELERPLVGLIVAFSRDSLRGLLKRAEKASMMKMGSHGEGRGGASDAWADLAAYVVSLQFLETKLQFWSGSSTYLKLANLMEEKKKNTKQTMTTTSPSKTSNAIANNQEDSKDLPSTGSDSSSRGFWEPEEEKVAVALREGLKGLSELMTICVVRDLGKWRECGHGEGPDKTVLSHPSFFLAVESLRSRSVVVKHHLIGHRLWDSCLSYVVLQLDEFFVKYAVQANFSAKGLERFEAETRAVVAALAGTIGDEAAAALDASFKKPNQTTLPRTFSALELWKLPRQEVIKMRSQLHDSGMSADQRRLVLRTCNIRSLTGAEALAISKKRLERRSSRD